MTHTYRSEILIQLDVEADKAHAEQARAILQRAVDQLLSQVSPFNLDLAITACTQVERQVRKHGARRFEVEGVPTHPDLVVP